MKSRLLIPFLTVFLITSCNLHDKGDQAPQSLNELRESFLNPEPSAFPKVYWWWLNGNTDTARLREEINAMHNAGISGFDIFEIGVPKTDNVVKPGPAFMSDESLGAIKFALDRAGELGMQAGLNMASSWNAGGNWITPEHSAKSIYLSRISLNEESALPVKIPFPTIEKTDQRGSPKLISFAADGKPVYRKEIAVLAIPKGNAKALSDTSLIQNISQYFNPLNDELNWKAPEGEWDILRFVCSSSGEQLKLPGKNSVGPIIDHFDAGATTFHFNYILSRLRSVIPDIGKSALKSLYLASYEATGNAWSPGLPLEFRSINGYDISKFLPALFDENVFAPEVYKKFRSDFQRTLSEMMINNFYSTAREIANSNGLKINSEAGGPGYPLHNVPVEPLRSQGMLDLPRGEFWINHNRLNADGIDILRVVKEVSASSHIYNKGIVEEEAFTTFQHWQEAPCDMKPSGDRAFCEGMNRVVVHGFSHNPEGSGNPGIVYGAGTHFNDKRVWWPMVKPFNEYLSRLSSVFMNSSFEADVLFYYGDHIPNYAGHKNSRFTVGPGYDYEVINTEILLKLGIEDGKLRLPDGDDFHLLVMADEPEINAQVLHKIAELAGNGAVIIGEKPGGITRIPDGEEPEKYHKIIRKIWTNPAESPAYPDGASGKVCSGIDPGLVLERMNVIKDVSYQGDELSYIDFIHYKNGEVSVYFLCNTGSEYLSREIAFRQESGSPEIWDPVIGTTVTAGIYNTSKGTTTLPLTFAPWQSLLIVFGGNEETPHYRSVSHGSVFPPQLIYTTNGLLICNEGKYILESEERSDTIINITREQRIEGAWELFFPAGKGAPDRVIMPGLTSWTASENDGIKYFSGIATYKKTFQYDINSIRGEGFRTLLDLGNFSKIASISLNGSTPAIIWTEPHLLDVTDLLKPGDNTLLIEVANTWSNRLKGDAVTGDKYTGTNIRTTNIPGLNKIQVPWKDVPLIESGLFGPVKLITLKETCLLPLQAGEE